MPMAFRHQLRVALHPGDADIYAICSLYMVGCAGVKFRKEGVEGLLGRYFSIVSSERQVEL